jgi:hypothetical protein
VTSRNRLVDAGQRLPEMREIRVGVENDDA